MENELVLNREYSQITDLYFAVWEDKGAANYIWVKIADKKLETGVQAVAEDPVAAKLDGDNKRPFIELITYAEDGTPILNFDRPEDDINSNDCGSDIPEEVLESFRLSLQKLDILGWRNHFPSNRQGVSWRIDIYKSSGQKHMDGKARFPMEWGAFSKAMSELVEKTGVVGGSE